MKNNFNQHYENGESGKLATFFTPQDNCEYQQLEKYFCHIGKYECTIIVFGKTISFMTKIEDEDEKIIKKVRLEYYKNDQCSVKTKEIVEKYYKK